MNDNVFGLFCNWNDINVCSNEFDNEKLRLDLLGSVELWNGNCESEWIAILLFQCNVIVSIWVVIIILCTLRQTCTIITLFGFWTHINNHILVDVAKLTNSVTFVEEIRIGEIALTTKWSI